MTVSTNTYYTVFNAQGVVLRTGSAPEDQIDAQADTSLGEYVIYTKSVIETDVVTNIVVDEAGAIISTPVVETKPETVITATKLNFLANGVDFVSFSPLAVSARMTILMPPNILIDDLIDFQVTDGVAEITTTEVGSYVVHIIDGVALPYKATINAN